MEDHPNRPHPDVQALTKAAADGNAAFMNGDMDRWLSLIPHSTDFSLLSPFGRWSIGFDPAPEWLAEMSRSFKSGTTTLEVITSHATNGMIVLVAIERQTAVVGHLPEQDWSLRVTLVYRRVGDNWLQIHRHADPLVKRIPLETLAAMAA
jgi:ketosteroid isomerase-like protein